MHYIDHYQVGMGGYWQKHNHEEPLSAEKTPGPHQTKDQRRTMSPLHFQDCRFIGQTYASHVYAFWLSKCTIYLSQNVS